MSAARGIATNTLWNLLGMVGPMVAAVWAIPILVNGMGTERFGMMTIVWMAVGYFSLFDLGLGRALTKLVAERYGTPREAAIPSLARRGIRMMWLLGICGGAIVAMLSPWLAGHALKMPSDLRQEALASLLILAATVPFVIVSAGSVGILQGLHRFREITWVRLPLGLLNYIAPVLVLGFSRSLVAVTLVVAITRILAAFMFSWQVRSALHVLDRPSQSQPDDVSLRDMLHFGGWVTVSSVIGPVMVYFDRFLIGALVGTAAVAYYTTPYEVISRFSLLPGALLGVMFPALASHFSNPVADSRRLYARASKIIVLLMLVPVGWTVLFATEGLELWLGEEFSRQAAASAQWLAVGVFVNAVAGLPFAALQGHGRPDLTAKLHAIELVVYLPALWMAIKSWGIVGAAVIWILRNLLDFVVLTLLCNAHVPAVRMAAVKTLWTVVPACVGLLMLALLSSFQIRVVIALGLAIFTSALLWPTVRDAGLWPFKRVSA